MTACPANQNGKSADALVMTPLRGRWKPEQENFDKVAMNDAYLKKDIISDKTVKSIQFAKPYFQFSAASRCAETTYIAGPASWWATEYVHRQRGWLLLRDQAAAYPALLPRLRGPWSPWGFSLFEDNAEFAYGFFHAQDAIRKELLIRMEA